MLKTITKNEGNITKRSDSRGSLLLGEEANSNKLNLFYENMRQQLDRQANKDNLKIENKSFPSDNKKPKMLNMRREKTDFIRLPVSASKKNPLLTPTPIVRPKKHSTIRYSAREKLIIDWAFKKFEYEAKKEKKEPKNRFKHDFWFDEDEEILQGADCNKHINLKEYDDHQGDVDFYRKHRNNAVTGKNDIEMNRHSSQLDQKLLDLAKDRFKMLAVLDYKKKTFVKNQLRKSDSMPGLRCPILLRHDPHYKFKKHYKNTKLDLDTDDASTEKSFNTLADRAKTPRTEFSIELDSSPRSKNKKQPPLKENNSNTNAVPTKSILKNSKTIKKTEITDENDLNAPQNSPRFGIDESRASIPQSLVAISETDYLINDVSKANNDKKGVSNKNVTKTNFKPANAVKVNKIEKKSIPEPTLISNSSENFNPTTKENQDPNSKKPALVREKSMYFDKVPIPKKNIQAPTATSLQIPPNDRSKSFTTTDNKKNTILNEVNAIHSKSINFDIPRTTETPIADTRFNNLITLVNKSYILAEEKNIGEIIDKHDALKPSEEEKEEALLWLNRERHVGSAIARKAREAISSGEYSFNWKF